MDDAACSLIFETLAATYPHACDPEPFFSSPFQVLVLTILSAQTTDKQVWALRGPLFDAYPTPAALAAADTAELEAIVRPTGYYHAKARHLIGAARMLVAEYGGEVPARMEDLVRLPGVGRKTANIVLYHAFGRNDGVAVDTHVLRLAQRIGLSDHADPAGSRAGPDGLPPAREVGAGHGPADRARPGGLRRPAPALRGLPDQSALPVLPRDPSRRSRLRRRLRPVSGPSELPFPTGINQDTILDVLS